MMQSIGNILRGNEYQQTLKDGRWVSFANGVRKSRGNCCEMCKRGNVETNVHHIAYEAGKKPWDYGFDEVVLLCRSCHEAMHDELKLFRKFVFGRLSPQSFRILDAALAVALDHHDHLKFVHALAEFVGTPSMIERYSEAWRDFEKAKTEVQAKGDAAITRATLLKMEGRI